jgi:CBS domain-containing protein
MKVKDVMSKSPKAVYPYYTVKRVLKTLSKNRISACPVVNKNRNVVGIVAKRDVLKLIDVHSKIFASTSDLFGLVVAVLKDESFDSLKQTFKTLLNHRVDEIMTKKVYTIKPEDDLYKAIKLLDNYEINTLPVVKNKKLVGVISRTDVIRTLAEL